LQGGGLEGLIENLKEGRESQQAHRNRGVGPPRPRKKDREQIEVFDPTVDQKSRKGRAGLSPAADEDCGPRAPAADGILDKPKLKG